MCAKIKKIIPAPKGSYIYFSTLHVSGIHVPIIRRKLLYLCDTGIFVTLGGVWSAGRI